VNVTLIVQLAPAATLPPQLFVGLLVKLKSEELAPLTAIELIVSGSEPVLVNTVV